MGTVNVQMTRTGMNRPRVNGPVLTLLALGIASLLGCVTVQVEPYVLEPFPPRPGQSPVPLEGEPARPHVKIARLIATSSSADDDRMQGKILSYAGRMGADAVVMGQSDVIESTGLGQTYQSTNAAGVGNSLFGGMGSGMPFFFDPWTYVQAPVDRVEYINYLSGVAIRYQDVEKALRLCSQHPLQALKEQWVPVDLLNVRDVCGRLEEGARLGAPGMGG